MGSSSRGVTGQKKRVLGRIATLQARLACLENSQLALATNVAEHKAEQQKGQFAKEKKEKKEKKKNKGVKPKKKEKKKEDPLANLVEVKCTPHATLTDGKGVTPNEIRQKELALAAQINSSVFLRAPSDYYTWELVQRRDVLGAQSVHQLCKTIVMKNTRFKPTPAPADADPNAPFNLQNNEYYLVVLQYTTKLHSGRLNGCVRDLGCGLGKKDFNFRLVSPEENQVLTGYGHNGVTPIGTSVDMPIILSDRMLLHHREEDEPKPQSEEDRVVYLGAGEIDLKWRFNVQDFMFRNKHRLIIGDVCYDGFDIPSQANAH